jgi:hypothetical protein
VCGYVKGGMPIGIHFVKPEVCGFRIYPLLEGVYVEGQHFVERVLYIYIIRFPYYYI